MFKIESVYRNCAELVVVKVTMSSLEWSKVRLMGGLGALYGIDISNAVYHAAGVKASNPIVDDSAKARGGIKVIELLYADTAWKPCNNLVLVDFKTRKRVA